jgi:hypothetical protein
MSELITEIIQVYRQKTYRIIPSSRVRNREEAVQFVNERGFITFWPAKDIPMPSLWVAANGDRPVADDHDDPGHVTWGWKDDLLGLHKWYYGRVLALKNSMISLNLLPSFYALSPNYGDPENDYMEDYRKGILPMEARQVYETLLKEGPMDSISLRKKSHLGSADSNSRFNKALEVLQTSFRIVPAGVCDAGSWHYAFLYDLFHNQFSDAVERSRLITEQTARKTILETYFNSVGGCTRRDMLKTFRWPQADLDLTLRSLVEIGFIQEAVTIPGEKYPFFIVQDLIPPAIH